MTVEFLDERGRRLRESAERDAKRADELGCRGKHNVACDCEFLIPEGECLKCLFTVPGGVFRRHVSDLDNCPSAVWALE
jgi:hypothetical protein